MSKRKTLRKRMKNSLLHMLLASMLLGVTPVQAETTQIGQSSYNNYGFSEASEYVDTEFRYEIGTDPPNSGELISPFEQEITKLPFFAPIRPHFFNIHNSLGEHLQEKLQDYFSYNIKDWYVYRNVSEFLGVVDIDFYNDYYEDNFTKFLDSFLSFDDELGIHYIEIGEYKFAFHKAGFLLVDNHFKEDSLFVYEDSLFPLYSARVMGDILLENPNRRFSLFRHIDLVFTLVDDYFLIEQPFEAAQVATPQIEAEPETIEITPAETIVPLITQQIIPIEETQDYEVLEYEILETEELPALELTQELDEYEYSTYENYEINYELEYYSEESLLTQEEDLEELLETPSYGEYLNYDYLNSNLLIQTENYIGYSSIEYLETYIVSEVIESIPLSLDSSHGAFYQAMLASMAHSHFSAEFSNIDLNLSQTISASETLGELHGWVGIINS
ncbi:MAG: hypothetical protein FWF50_04335 [Defluviitaleaceae bacterium]|nr:hypothetical protein [Defluviitaleaceae bacterium]